MRRLAVLVMLALSAVSATVRAQPASPAPSPETAASRPWAANVSEEDQTIALGFYGEGNTEFLYSRFAQALERYRKAVARWDHPAIRFNMAVALINLGQLVEARDSLERALAYGAAPLGDDVHVQALTYRKLLDGQLARLALRCAEPGAAVTLDGKLVLTGPGEASAYLLPGDHQLVATKPGFLTTSRTLTLTGGAAADAVIELVRFEPAPTLERRMPRWKPYSVVAGGAVVAGLGGLLYAWAAHDYGTYDDRVRSACPRGCNTAQVAALPDLRAIEDSADRKQTVAAVLLVGGVATLAVGAVTVYRNQPRAVRLRSTVIAVGPSAGGARLSVRGSF